MATFGKTDIGASDNNVDDTNIGTLYNNNSTKIIYTLFARIEFLAGRIGMCIYDDNAAYPDNMLNYTIFKTPGTSAQWISIELSRPISLVSGDYWITLVTSTACDVFYDVGSDDYAEVADSHISGASNPYPSGGTTGSRSYSVYASTVPLSNRFIGTRVAIDGAFWQPTGYDSIVNDKMMVRKVTAIEDLAIGTIGAYLNTNWVAGRYAKPVVYSDNGGSPDVLLATGAEVEGDGSGGPILFPLSSTVNFTDGTSYWIGFHAGGAVAMSILSASLIAGEWYVADDTYSDGPADPINTSSSTGTDDMVIWAEEGGAVGDENAQQGVLVSML